ncbi:MAG: acetylxylan esterase [Clostridiales bacterium]|nr:acetylxylan esterase [Clostridiales bacterium]
MPMLDMPLSQLKTYMGINPCPPDIDAFWDRQVQAMEALGTDCELIEADFQVPGAKCYHLYFTGMGGARVHAKLAMPADIAAPVPAICIYHGYAGASPEFSSLLSYVQAGFAAAAMDCRGQGGLSEDKGGVIGNTLHGHIIRGLAEGDPAKLLFTQIFLDAAQLARIVMAMPEVDERRVGATGASQGGALTLACAALTPTLNRAAPVYPFLCDYQRVWEMDMALDAYAELRDYFRRYDPLHEHETETFTLLGYIDNQHIAHRIRAKTLMLTGLMDNICPPSTQFAAYNKMTCDKQMILYPDFAHENLPGGGDRILQFMLGMQP